MRGFEEKKMKKMTLKGVFFWGGGYSNLGPHGFLVQQRLKSLEPMLGLFIPLRNFLRVNSECSRWGGGVNLRIFCPSFMHRLHVE